MANKKKEEQREKTLGETTLNELEALCRQMRDENKTPDEIAAAFKARFLKPGETLDNLFPALKQFLPLSTVNITEDV